MWGRLAEDELCCPLIILMYSAVLCLKVEAGWHEFKDHQNKLSSFFFFFFCHPPPSRICEFRQPGQRSGRHPGDERLPDWHEETESAAQEAQGCQPPVLSDRPRMNTEMKVSLLMTCQTTFGSAWVKHREEITRRNENRTTRKYNVDNAFLTKNSDTKHPRMNSSEW